MADVIGVHHVFDPEPHFGLVQPTLPLWPPSRTEVMHGANTAKVAAVTVAICVHGAVALSLAAKEDIQAEGADGGTDVRLGNAKRNARANAATGKPDAAPRQNGTGGRQKAVGKAAASN